MTITEFLEARIAEDEADCAPDPDWDDYKGHCDAAGVHHAPERARAECAAKRAIIRKAQRAEAAFEQSINPASSAASFALAEVMQHLAAVYADHPDYQQEWAK